MQAALAQSEERYRQLVERSPDVFYRVATSDDPLMGRVEFVSHGAERMTGYLPDEFVRDPGLWIRLIHPDDIATVSNETLTSLSTGRPVTRAYRLIDRSGITRWIQDRVTPEVGPTGKVLGFSGVARDVTEQRQLELQFQQSQKLESIGHLAGGIAHDFNNLLTVILGTVDLNLADLREGDPLYQELQNIREAGERAAGLTRQLLAFSRKQILQPKVLELNAVVLNALDMVRRLIGEHIHVVFKSSDDLGRVSADPGQVEQVLVNLAINARDAMPTGGTIIVETGNVTLDEHYHAVHPMVEPGSYVMLAVSDTGCGMDEATRLRVFEPFFSTKGPGKGTGLGLSTVYGIVKQSGGSIWVYSEPGQGSTFKIYLPRVDAPAETARPVLDVTSVHGMETVLVVEDEPTVRSLAQRLLKSAGYTVLAAASGEEALALLAGHDERLHLLITDVVMPGMSGRDLAERVQAMRAGVRVLYTSGYTDEAIVQHGVLEAGTHLLNKPYTAATLTRKVREVLSSSPS
jgi:PAS domain S-box-containing protein